MCWHFLAKPEKRSSSQLYTQSSLGKDSYSRQGVYLRRYSADSVLTVFRGIQTGSRVKDSSPPST